VKTICLIEGDGIGHEVIPAAAAVLAALQPSWKLISAEAGYDCFRRSGESLPARTLELARGADAVLFGAATSPSVPVAGFRSAIRTLRRELDLFANLRPALSLPLEGHRPGTDLLLVRENSEGAYVAQERRYGDLAIADVVITRAASLRIGEVAAREALRRRGRLTVVHKANVLPVSQGLFRQSVLEAAAGFAGLEIEERIVDAAAMELVMHPERFDVLVMTNLLGDVLSDLCAGLVGGLGLAPSANLGTVHALFEPVHGSAPDIAGRGVANPSAALLSLALLLEHLGQATAAQRLRRALLASLQAGVRTPDLGGQATTDQLTGAVLERLGT
jgi:homoisocitrate dehydrogenase